MQHQNLKAGRAQNDAKAEPVCDKSLGAPQRNLSKGIAQKGQWRWEHQTHLLLRPTFSQGKLGDLKSCTLMPAKEKRSQTKVQPLHSRASGGLRR